MVFSSIQFLFFFLPVFLLAYFAVPGTRAKNITTLLFSLLFYGWGEPWFVLVLLSSIVLNWAAAQALDQLNGRARKLVLAVAVTANLLLLGVFKYAIFVAGVVGLADRLPPIPLPLGISFFTFHCLSYLIDVYRRRFRANHDLIQVAIYISLFPQLIAGPIVRYRTVAAQLRRRRHTLGRASAGMRIFVIGLAQKVLIADQVAGLAEAVFDHARGTNMADSWLGLVAYTVQIYFDFAGYSSMAIGLGIVLGFTFPRNFRLPYASLTVTEFWRRWHISLSSWLRDYLYIPLGGSRGGAWKTWRNLAIVFLLCGLWHGAKWTFVLWGAWHGAFLIAERAGLRRRLDSLPAAARWTYALLAVMGGWVLFRSPDPASAGTLYASLVGLHGLGPLGFETHVALTPLATLALACGCVIAVAPRWFRIPRPTIPVFAAAADTVFTFGLLALAALFVAASTYSPFLYFRF